MTPGPPAFTLPPHANETARRDQPLWTTRELSTGAVARAVSVSANRYAGHRGPEANASAVNEHMSTEPIATNGSVDGHRYAGD